MKINQKTKFKIMVISVMTSVELIVAVLFFVFCSKPNNMSSILYSYGIMLFTYIVAIYGFIISSEKSRTNKDTYK